MKTEPHENFEIITQLNQEEILEKLDTIIETDYSKYHKIKRIDKLFLGHYTFCLLYTSILLFLLFLFNYTSIIFFKNVLSVYVIV